jgi:tryptophan synthase alpha chain
MSRLTPVFAALKKQKRAALIPYVMAGDPQPWVAVPLLHALVDAGANIIELGVPFSDPMADGPVIQYAAERALKHGVTLARVLDIVREFRTKDGSTPIVLMGYLNPFEAMGYEAFAAQAAAAGVDGVLTVDLPPEEAEPFAATLRAHGLDPIFLVAPTSGPDRIRRIAEVARGYLYYVSLRGVTGASHLDVNEVSSRLKTIRRYTDLPLGVGFGISSPETAAAVAAVADAVVVGSAIVNRIAANADQPERALGEVPVFVRSLRAAMDQARAPHAAGAGA